MRIHEHQRRTDCSSIGQLLVAIVRSIHVFARLERLRKVLLWHNLSEREGAMLPSLLVMLKAY